MIKDTRPKSVLTLEYYISENTDRKQVNYIIKVLNKFNMLHSYEVKKYLFI